MGRHADIAQSQLQRRLQHISGLRPAYCLRLCPSWLGGRGAPSRVDGIIRDATVSRAHRLLGRRGPGASVDAAAAARGRRYGRQLGVNSELERV